MIYIANPLYDAVFKFLLEDLEVAKRFIGIIINKKIIDIELLPQEKIIQKEDIPIRVQRLDFVAKIKQDDGTNTKVLIEIQKSNKSYHADLLRFRGYLAKQYQIDDLPIITIYILGFLLEDLPHAVTHVNREYIDVYTNKKIQLRNEFIEKLTHDCYIIQVPRLKLVLKNKLSELLEIFNQDYRKSKDKIGSKVLEIPYLPKDKDLIKIYQRLEKANADEAMREKMEDEEYLEMVYDELYGDMDRQNQHLKQELELKDKLLQEEKAKLIETAKLLKSMNVDWNIISNKTGLNLQEIEELE